MTHTATRTPTRTRDAVTRVSFGPSADRRSVLDRAHRGDIIGALGRVPSVDTGPRRGLRHRLVTLLAVMGPGVVVLVADNDAGGISTYAQVGQDDGLRFLRLLVVLTDLRADALFWTMPPLESLPAPLASRARTVGLVVLRCYLLLAAVAVVVKVTTLIVGS